jgi:Na+-transporting NADH:ubiquinone oxidoreductase subunit E
MADYISIALKAIFVENILLSLFLGMCSFLACSKKIDTAIGLGLAVVFVLTVTAPTNWLINHYLLADGAMAWISPSLATVDLSFLQFICYIAVIAAMVQLVEMVLDKFSQPFITRWAFSCP